MREKLSKAGPAKGRTSSADNVNELTTTPTMEAVAPSESANTGSVALAMNAAIDWEEVHRHKNDERHAPDGIAHLRFHVALLLFRHRILATIGHRILARLGHRTFPPPNCR